MTDQDKIRMFDSIIESISQSFVNEDVPVMIGVLNEPTGINGFHLAEVGHPVFELKDRYIIYLESKTPVEISGYGKETIYRDFKIAVPYYKTTLYHLINFK